MAKKAILTKNITVEQFENGYWYAEEIKAFAKQIGIRNTSKFRKDQLEELIKAFIRTGKVPSSTKKTTAPTLVKDYELGLKPALPIINYTSNKVTKQFIESEARKIRPNLKKKSGARYRLNRWREAQLNGGKKITYADLIREYLRLNEVRKVYKLSCCLLEKRTECNTKRRDSCMEKAKIA
jgi:hypothetical protein